MGMLPQILSTLISSSRLLIQPGLFRRISIILPRTLNVHQVIQTRQNKESSYHIRDPQKRIDRHLYESLIVIEILSLVFFRFGIIYLLVKTYSGSTERQSSQSRVPFQERHPHLLLNKPAQTRPLSIHTNHLKVICLPLCIRMSGSPNEDNFSKISKLF